MKGHPFVHRIFLGQELLTLTNHNSGAIWVVGARQPLSVGQQVPGPLT
jgi:hypothetical protein